MLGYPHHPDPATVQRTADELGSVFYPVQSMTPAFLAGRSSLIWASNAKTGLDAARLAHALEQPADEVRWYLGESNACFERGLGHAAPFDLMDLLDQLYVAIVRGDAALARKLASLDEARYAVDGVVPPDAARHEYAILGALLAGPPAAAAGLLRDAQAALDASRLPRVPKAEWATAFAILAATLARDPAAAAAAFDKRAAAFAHRFANPLDRDHPDGLLDLHGLALAALARHAGVAPAAGNAYVPLDLLPG